MLSWLENSYLRPYFLADDGPKVGHTDLVLVYDHDLLIGLCVQGYKFLCAAVTICATHTHRQTAFWPAYMTR